MPFARRGRSKKSSSRKAPVDEERIVIDRFAATGEGVGADPDGRAVLVARTAPGDVVIARITGTAPPRRGRLRTLETRSPMRREPPCPLFDRCGGCGFMHLPEPEQLAAKQRLVSELLARSLPEGAVPAITASRPGPPLQYRIRAKWRVKVSGNAALVGYRAADSHALVPIDACAVLAPELERAIEPLRHALRGCRAEGEARVALGAAGRPVAMLWLEGDLTSAWEALDRLVRAGTFAGVGVFADGASEPAIFGDPRPVLTQDDEPLVLSQTGFSQPSAEGARYLADRVYELARPEGEHVVEYFAGSGTLSVRLARGPASFAAIESEHDAVRALRANLEGRELAGKASPGDAEQTPVPPTATVVVLDPPRAGARNLCEKLARSKVKRCVYVSCDAATFARDAAELLAGPWKLVELELVDLFPQTPHVELVALFERQRR